MARPRTPTHTKEITGTARPDRQKATEPKPARGKPPAPDHFDDFAKQVFNDIADIADGMGVLTPNDRYGLQQLTLALIENHNAHKAIKDRGGATTYQRVSATGGVMWRAYPEVAIAADADRRIQTWLGKFGLTPADRSRVTVAPLPDRGGFDEF